VTAEGGDGGKLMTSTTTTVGDAAQNVFVVSHESKKISQKLPPTTNWKTKQDDSKTNFDKVPNPLDPLPPLIPPLSRQLLDFNKGIGNNANAGA
jgi:hypothetical protein